MKFSLLIIAILCLVTPVFAETAINQDVNNDVVDGFDIFQERLNQFVNASKAVNENSIANPKEVSNMQNVLDKLWSFADEFPLSKFASDSRSLQIITLYFGSFGIKDKSDEAIKKMEELAKRYPDSRLDNYSIKKMKELVGDDWTAPEYLMPNKYLVNYMKATSYLYLKDFNSAIKYFLLLKENSDFMNNFAKELYINLTVSYEAMGNKKEALATAKEGLSKVTNDPKAQELFQKKINKLQSSLSN